MEKTLKLFNSIKTLEFDGMDMEQLAEVYVRSLNPSILATAFSKCYKLIIKISRNYYGLNQNDIASFSLEVLDFCLRSYIPGKASFITYFSKVLNNRFREETQSLSTDKRKILFHSGSLDAIIDEGFEFQEMDSEIPEIEEIVDSLLDFGLTERELLYCKLLLEGYKNKEIADVFGVSIMTLSNIRKKLRSKLNPLRLKFA